MAPRRKPLSYRIVEKIVHSDDPVRVTLRVDFLNGEEVYAQRDIGFPPTFPPEDVEAKILEIGASIAARLAEGHAFARNVEAILG